MPDRQLILLLPFVLALKHNLARVESKPLNTFLVLFLIVHVDSAARFLDLIDDVVIRVGSVAVGHHRGGVQVAKGRLHRRDVALEGGVGGQQEGLGIELGEDLLDA